jgi:CheY-like chemotaxis protein
MKVLIVEDNADMRDLLGVLLGHMGHVAVLANQGQEALDKAKTEKPELIMVDIMMPGMDGRELTRILRATPETKDIPILAATAMFRSGDLQACIEAGCNDYITQPFTFEELRRKITALA